LVDYPSKTRTDTLAAVQEVMAADVRRRGRMVRALYLVLGLGFVGIGMIGVFLPLIPTTGPLLLAAFFFARSSDRLHAWLVGHPRFGRFISDFQSGRGIPVRTKVVAVAAMTAAFTYSAGWVVEHIALRAVVAAVGIWAIWYVLRLPTASGRDD
jgi:hypothetical protein